MSARLVIGVGNPDRGDDGAGPAVIERLRREPPENAGLMVLDGEGTRLMRAWREREHVILVDAARAHGTPGRLHHFDAKQARLPSAFLHYSSHAFGVAEAVELARELGRLPARLELYAIEGAGFAAGVPLSTEVSAAVGAVADAIRRHALAAEHDR